MPYTTGELAKLCGVSVRTVQYYDERAILVPNELSEGGRRLYGEDAVKRLEIICFLRELGVSISAIADLLADNSSQETLSLLLDRQRDIIQSELSDCRERLLRVEALQRALKSSESRDFEAMGDAVIAVKRKKKMRNLRMLMLLLGLPLDILQWVAIALWIALGNFWPFVLWCPLAVVYGVWVSVYYFKRVAYICPCCHSVFRPRFRQAFFAKHTPTLRRLTCTHCGKNGFCIEIYNEERENNDGKNS